MGTEPPAARVFGYPVVLDIEGWRCLVVGGGRIAARRVRGLLASGAVVTVVAPDVVGELGSAGSASIGSESAVGSRLEVQHRVYEPGEAAGYRLVLTATGDPAVDRRVVSDATAAGVLVGSAERDVPGALHLPAVYREGPVVVALSTDGASPALARWLRDRVAELLPSDVRTVAGLLDEARSGLQRVGRSTDSVDWDPVISDIVPMVESGRIDEARSRLVALVEGAG